MPDPVFLPLTPFEQYMLADDTPKQPMAILVRWRLRGRAEKEPLIAAFQAAVVANPFFTARIARHGRNDVWVEGADLPPLEWYESGDEHCSTAVTCLDLRHGPGSRFWVNVSGETTELTGLIHHAVADGIACLRFFADWLAAYAEQLAGKPCTPRPPAFVDLSLRAKLDLAPPVPLTFGMRVRGFFTILLEAFKFNVLQPIAMRDTTSSPQGSAAEREELFNLTLTVEESSALLRAADAANVTLNDLLLRDAYLTIAAWQDSQAARARLRLTVPISMRDKTHEKLPACNIMSYVSLTRRIADTSAPEALLQGLHEEMKLIRYWRIGGWFLGMIDFAHRLRILKPALRLPVCYSTLVLSNLGRITAIIGDRLPRHDEQYIAGNLVLEDIAGAPPTRRRTPLSVAAFYYNRQLTISMRVDERVFSRTGARAWLELYRQHLLASAAREVAKSELGDDPNSAEPVITSQAEPRQS